MKVIIYSIQIECTTPFVMIISYINVWKNLVTSIANNKEREWVC